jgi:bifunctional non-homologous end joining protein LigD
MSPAARETRRPSKGRPHRSDSSLAEYQARRDFTKTPEPRGHPGPQPAGSMFVVQKHDASRPHYDFRLEVDGVLKSWAVPKGPSLDPADKRLAMQTEDHPLEYGSFEGIIPEGEYGGGTVLLWDRGTWAPTGDPAAGIRAGRLKFTLAGEKLRGGFTLIRLRGRGRRDADGRSWLLIKERDEHAKPSAELSVTDARSESVVTGRRIVEVATGRARTWHSNRSAKVARRAAPPTPRPARAKPGSPGRPPPGARPSRLRKFVQPQLATLVAAPPAGDEWLHELKFDGYRILCRIEKGRVTLWSRNARDWTAQFPGIASAASQLPVRAALLDGEIAVLLPNGTTSFQALQNALSAGDRGQLVYFVFDLLHLDGQDLTGAPLEARKTALEELIGTGRDGPIRYSAHVVGQGEAFFRQACRRSLEGVVSKRRDRPYEPGRGRSWLKVKCIQEQEFVVGGFTEPKGTRAGLGALLLGVHDDGDGLAYAGKVGTGFTGAAARRLRERLDGLRVEKSPFRRPPPGAREARWVKPELVAEVEFTEWTTDGRLRHPSFKGLREDKPAGEVVRERPAPAQASASRGGGRRTRKTAVKQANASAGPQDDAVVAGVRISHPDRVVYPAQGITKAQLAGYYAAIAEHMLPHLRSRPTVLLRCPEGLGQECFYQKHAGSWAPSSLRRVPIREKRKTSDYLVVDDVAGLVSLVQMGALEFHTWNAQADSLETPDRLVFDLDPGPDVPWPAVRTAARLVRARLDAHGLTSFVKTTGGKGLHVVAPIAPGPDWDACLAFAHQVTEALVAETPRAFVATMAKVARKGKIFIDYLRNQRGATSVAAYSTRARPGAPVSTPITWDELDSISAGDHFTIETVQRRLARRSGDPWEGYGAATRQHLPRTERRRT